MIAKDVGQFDDILRNFINETNKYEGDKGDTHEEVREDEEELHA